MGVWGGGDFALMTGLINLVALSGVIILGSWLSGEPPRMAGWREIRVPYWIGLVLAAGGATVVLGEFSNLILFLFPLPPWLTRTLEDLTGGPIGWTLFSLALVAPATEELLFRGLLLRGFARRYGTGAGLVLSSALFALFHLNLWQALPAFLAGLYLGRVFLATGSLVPSLLVHGLFNGLPVTLAALGFVVAGYNVPHQIGAPGFQPPLWVAGGFAVLGIGLIMTKTWSPLSPQRVSDKVTE